MKYVKLETLRKEKKLQKDFLDKFLREHLLSPNFTPSDRTMVAKLMKQQYKEGFLNGKQCCDCREKQVIN